MVTDEVVTHLQNLVLVYYTISYSSITRLLIWDVYTVTRLLIAIFIFHLHYHYSWKSFTRFSFIYTMNS